MVLRHALVLALSAAAAAKPSDHASCDECVAAGYGWSPTRQRCGGFSNKICDLAGVKPPPAPYPAAAKGQAGTKDAGRRFEYEDEGEDQDDDEDYEEEDDYEDDFSPQEDARTQEMGARPSAASASTHEASSQWSSQAGKARKPLKWRTILAPFLSAVATAIGIVWWNKLTKRDAARKLLEDKKRCVLDIHQILFTQATIESTFRDGRPISEMIGALRDGSLSVQGDWLPLLNLCRFTDVGRRSVLTTLFFVWRRCPPHSRCAQAWPVLHAGSPPPLCFQASPARSRLSRRPIDRSNLGDIQRSSHSGRIHEEGYDHQPA